MDHGQQIDELYSIIYKLIDEVESLKKINEELRQENSSLKQELEKYRNPKDRTGGVCYLLEKIKQKATPVYESIRQSVLKGHVVGADETGVNINGKNHCAWTFQNPVATYIAINKSRGTKAIDQIMPEGFGNNTLVTDCWPSYFKENAAGHQLCTAHLLRELKFFTQKYPKNGWSPRFSKLITDALQMRNDDKLTPQKSKEIILTFQQALTAMP